MRITVQQDEEDYRLVGPMGDEGAMVPYGQIATLEIDGEIFYAQLEAEDEGEPEVFRIDAVDPCDVKVEEVEFPPSVVKAQRALDEAIEATSGVGIALVDTEGDEAPDESATE